MIISSTVLAAIGAATAAILTGIFSFVNLVISKEQKTTEFRQQWINELRDELTEFTSSAQTFLSFLIHINDKSKGDDFSSKSSEFYTENVELISNITKHYDSIRLRVNPKKDKVFLEKLDALNDLAASKTIPKSVEDVNKVTQELIDVSQDLLKNEWIRVKRGELSFFLTKWLIALSVIAIIGSTFHYKETIIDLLISVKTIK